MKLVEINWSKELHEINRNYTKLGIVSREKEERLEGVAKVSEYNRYNQSFRY